MLERFTGEARKVVVLAQELAKELEHGHIGTEHLLLGLLSQDEWALRTALAGLGLTYDRALAAVQRVVPPSTKPPGDHLQFTPGAKKALELSLLTAHGRADKVIRPAHMLLGLLAERDGVAAQVLLQDGRTDERIRRAVTAAIGSAAEVPAGPRTPAADEVQAFAEQLAAMAAGSSTGGGPVGSHHLLAARMLLRDGRTLEQVRRAAAATMGPGAEAGRPGRRTPTTDHVLWMAEQLAAGAAVGSQHLLEALATVRSGIAGQALARLGITSDALAAQIDAIDLRESKDWPPDLTSAGFMTLAADVDAGTVTLSSTDPELVEQVCRLVELAGGPLTGDGVQAGPFIGLHNAMTTIVAAIAARLTPPPAGGDRPADVPA